MTHDDTTPTPQGEPTQEPGAPPQRDDPGAGPRRLFRSQKDRVIGGVAGGLGRYFGVDPIFFRIGFVALTFFGGAGLFLYLAAWIFVPPDGRTGHALDPRLRNRWLVLAGAIALGIAVLAVLDEVFHHGDWGWGWWFGGFLGPLAVIAIVGVLVWAVLKDRRPNVSGVDAGWVAGRIALVLAILAGATVLVVGGALATAAGGGAAVAALVVAIGVLLVVAAFRGGARWLIVPALLLALPVGVVSAADIDLDGGIGDREYRPTSVVELHDTYQLGMGRLEVDLRDVELPRGDRPLGIDLGVGEALVYVPRDVCVAFDSRVGAGYARVFGRDSGGLDVDWDVSPVAAPGVSRLVIKADVGVGAVQVVHDPSEVRDYEGRFDHNDPESGADNERACRRPPDARRERRGTP
jgi:phage shock protein PspC (stress-responsive transcriptional regulator)/predicted membrane protein